MRPRNKHWVLGWSAAILTLTMLALAGCADVQVVDTTPATNRIQTFTSPLAVESEERNLAVMAVDFDPPLNYKQLIRRRQSVALLVVIENTGPTTERNLTVRAQLSSPEDLDLLLTQEAGVDKIAPGEIKIVRFAPLDEIPIHHVYHLEVAVDPLQGEKDTGDNSKAFDIQIHEEQGKP